MVRTYSPHCPNCAAALRFEVTGGSAVVDCEYCDATLIIDVGRIRFDRPKGAPAARPEVGEPLAPPPPSLVSRDAARFSLRVLEQPAGRPSPEHFETLELPGDRFALVMFVTTDAEGAPIPLDTSAARAVLCESLGDDGDPGLAVNLFLEELARQPAFQRLESIVAVFDPARTTALVHAAGGRAGAMWVSTEEGRAITAAPAHQPLEKLHLAMRGDHFDNAKPIRMAALDVLVVASFSFMNDPAMRSSAGGVLGKVLRENVAEEPERLVTLVKNEWWETRVRQSRASEPLNGDLRVAAVGARLAVPDASLDGGIEVEALSSRAFDVAIQRGPGHRIELCAIDADRQMLIALDPGAVAIDDAAYGAFREAVFAVLARANHGDFDNPRAAGRAGLEALRTAGVAPEAISVVVAHLSDVHRRVKYFAHGTKAGLNVGARGLRPDHEQQQFDGGGEVTLHEHERLIFLGANAYEGEVLRADTLAERWHGGKASHLFEALRLHWRTRRADRMLQKLVAVAAADGGAARRMLLVQGRA